MNEESEKVSNDSDKDAILKRTKSAKSRKKIAGIIDIKGAITLAIAVTSFLLVLTYLQTGSNSNSSNSHQTSYSSLWIPIFLAGSVISLTLFVIVEKKATSPPVDFKLLLSRGILPADIMIMIVGFSMFLVFQTIPIMVRNPQPYGFGGDPISATRVQLPFALILLVFGPTSGFIISRLRTSKSLIIGTIISAIGFFGLFLFHSTEFLISTDLGIIAIGLSLTAIGAQNTIVLNTPRQNSGISLGIVIYASLMRIIGSSIGPALAGMYKSIRGEYWNYTRVFSNCRSIRPDISYCCNIVHSINCVGYIFKIQCSSQMPKAVTGGKRGNGYNDNSSNKIEGTGMARCYYRAQQIWWY